MQYHIVDMNRQCKSANSIAYSRRRTSAMDILRAGKACPVRNTLRHLYEKGHFGRNPKMSSEAARTPAIISFVQIIGHYTTAPRQKNDPDGTRTRVTALKGPCLNLLTTGPVIKSTCKWSGQRDLNPRPPGPKPGALPSCAMPRLT